MQFTTKSDQETIELGKKLAAKLSGGEVLCLEGDLGGGKTHFSKGVAAGLGVKDGITSPTFVLRKDYVCRHNAVEKLYHFDAYRLDAVADTESLGLAETISDAKSVVIIEWADKIKAALPANVITVKFKYESENTRQITISGLNEL